MPTRPRPRHRPLAVLAVLAAGGVLAGCADLSEMTEAPPPCPPVELVPDASRMTRFADGGRDITDMAWQAELDGYQGSCKYSDSGVNLQLAVIMSVQRGPAGGDAAEVPYFVAVPAFYPADGAKQVFTARVPFTNNAGQARFRDGEVSIDIPLDDPADGPNTPVYLGLQLDREQFERLRRK